jgi:hypothetical protein
MGTSFVQHDPFVLLPPAGGGVRPTGFQEILFPPAIQAVNEAPLDPLVISGQGRAVSGTGCLQAGAQSGDNAGRVERVEGAGHISHREPAVAGGPVHIIYKTFRLWALVQLNGNGFPF